MFKQTKLSEGKAKRKEGKGVIGKGVKKGTAADL